VVGSDIFINLKYAVLVFSSNKVTKSLRIVLLFWMDIDG